jgi:hypothetical protein
LEAIGPRFAHHVIIAVLQCDGAIEIGEEDELGVLERESERFEIGSRHVEWFEKKVDVRKSRSTAREIYVHFTGSTLDIFVTVYHFDPHVAAPKS